MYKIGAKLGAKLGSKPVAKLDAKPGANYATICARFRERMQKTPKIAPTHEIAPFCPKSEENYTEIWSRRKKGCKKIR